MVKFQNSTQQIIIKTRQLSRAYLTEAFATDDAAYIGTSGLIPLARERG